MVADGSVMTGRLMTFRVGPGRFALPLEDVLGVQDSAGIGAGPDGEVRFQGQPVAALDARSLWWSGVNPPATAKSFAVIIVNSGRGSMALIVDCIEGIVEGVEMQPLPALVAPFVRDVFRGVIVHADGDRLVVDSAALSGAAAAGGQGGPGKA